MAKLQLRYINAIDNQEWPRDELRLTVDGSKVWSQGGVEVGDSFDLSYIEPINIDVLSQIQLVENDSLGNNDDIIDTHSPNISSLGSSVPFSGAGAEYRLVYDILQ